MSKKYLSIEVYEGRVIGNCGGYVGSEKDIYIEHEQGNVDESSIIRDGKAHLIFKPEQRSPTYWALKPVNPPPKYYGHVGPMSSGLLATSSDSRCRHVYHIHDRYETPAQYESLSR